MWLTMYLRSQALQYRILGLPVQSISQYVEPKRAFWTHIAAALMVVGLEQMTGTPGNVGLIYRYSNSFAMKKYKLLFFITIRKLACTLQHVSPLSAYFVQ